MHLVQAGCRRSTDSLMAQVRLKPVAKRVEMDVHLDTTGVNYNQAASKALKMQSLPLASSNPDMQTSFAVASIQFGSHDLIVLARTWSATASCEVLATLPVLQTSVSTSFIASRPVATVTRVPVACRGNTLYMVPIDEAIAMRPNLAHLDAARAEPKSPVAPEDAAMDEKPSDKPELVKMTVCMLGPHAGRCITMGLRCRQRARHEMEAWCS